MLRAFFLILLAAAACAQGRLSGVVVDESTGRPIAHAKVDIGRVPLLRSATSTVADADGRFEFQALAGGQYWIGCIGTGYVEIRGFSHDGPRVDVLDGDVAKVIVRMTPAGSIEGRLLASNGDPIPHAQVEALRSGTGISLTDRDGRFRLDGLPPGEYKLRARLNDAVRSQSGEARDESPTALPRIVFYGDVPASAAAVAIPVSRGASVTGVEFRVKPVPVVNIAGEVIDSSTGTTLKEGFIELRPEDSISPSDATPRVALVNGGFRFALLPAGDYQALVYRSAGVEAQPCVAQVHLSGASIADLKISMPAGGRLTGALVGPRAGLSALTLSRMAPTVSISAALDESGHFAFQEVPPGRYSLGFRGTPASMALTFKSIRQGSRVIAPSIEVFAGENLPLDVEVTRLLTVTGVVLDPNGNPVESAYAAFFPVDAPSVVRWMQAGKDGHFNIGLVAGEYRTGAFRTQPSLRPASCPTSRIVHLAESFDNLKLILCP